MFIRILFLVLTLLLSFSGTAFSAEDDPALAKTGDYIFRKSDLDRFIGYAPQYMQEQFKSSPQKEALIKWLMHQKIISDMARKEGFDKKAYVKEQLQYLVDDFLAKEYITYAVVDKISITEDELKEYYSRNRGKFTVPEQVKASHILIKINFGAAAEEKNKARDKAKQLLEWLKKGEKFETLAEHYSEDQTSKAKGGRLGYISKGQMAKSFDEAAFSMKPGQISDVVETDYGYHIIQIEDHKDAVTKTFEEVKGSIKEQLKNEAARSKVAEFMKNADKDAGLEIYSESLPGKKKK